MSEAGIYMIENKVNGKIYIGSSKKICDRFYKHKRELKKGIHGNPHLQAAYNKYGEKCFTYRVIESIENEDDLVVREQFWLDKFNKTKLYNIRIVAESNRGTKRSAEAVQKMRETRSIKPDPIEVIKEKEYITVADAAYLCKMSKKRVHNLLQRIGIRTRKDGNRTLINKEDFVTRNKRPHYKRCSGDEQYSPVHWAAKELNITEEEVMKLIENKILNTKVFYRNIHVSSSSITEYLSNLEE